MGQCLLQTISVTCSRAASGPTTWTSPSAPRVSTRDRSDLGVKAGMAAREISEAVTLVNDLMLLDVQHDLNGPTWAGSLACRAAPSCGCRWPDFEEGSRYRVTYHGTFARLLLDFSAFKGYGKTMDSGMRKTQSHRDRTDLELPFCPGNQ